MIDIKGTEDCTPDEGNKPTHNDNNNGTTTSGISLTDYHIRQNF